MGDFRKAARIFLLTKKAKTIVEVFCSGNNFASWNIEYCIYDLKRLFNKTLILKTKSLNPTEIQINHVNCGI